MIKIQDWIASIPDEEKHIAYVGEGLSEKREFLLYGKDWEQYIDYSFHLDLGFDPTSITTHDNRQVVQTTVSSTENKEESGVILDEITTKETYTVDNVQMSGHSLTDVASLAKSVDENGIRLTWLVLRQHTQLPGKLCATLRAVSSDAQSIKKSAIMVFDVDAAIVATPASKPPVSEFEQMEIEMDALRQQAFQSAEDARDYADKAAASLTDTRQAQTKAEEAATETRQMLEEIDLQLPPKTTENDEGKILMVVDGVPVWVVDSNQKAVTETVTVSSAEDTYGNHALTLSEINNGTNVTIAIPNEDGDSLPYVGNVFIRGKSTNLFPNTDANGVLLHNADGLLMVDNDNKSNAYSRNIDLGITYPAGVYRFGAQVSSHYTEDHANYGNDVGKTTCTIRFYNNDTMVYYAELPINHNEQKDVGMAPYPVGSTPQPFNRIVLYSGSGNTYSEYVDAVYKNVCIVEGGASALTYEPYDSRVHNLSDSPLTVTADPMTLWIEDVASFEVSYKKITYVEENETKLPAITTADNGKVLGVEDGQPIWMELETEPEPQPDPDALPSYYDSYMSDKVAVINSLMRGAALNGDAFVFITDQHTELNRNAGQSTRLIKHIGEHTKVNKVFSGGDVYCSNQVRLLDAYAAEMAEFGGDVHYAMGNHEYDFLTEADLFYAYDIHKGHQIGNAARHYYYVDNPQQKIRYVVLNGWTEGGVPAADLPAQLQWLQDEALQVEDGWGIILFTHQFFNREWSLTPDPATISPTAQTIEPILDNYSGGGEILGVFHGHIHQDMVNHTGGGIPVIGTTCDKYVLTQVGEFFATRTVGTVTEQAFDVVIVDRTARQFHCVRIGAKAFDGDGTPTDEQVEIRVVNFRET